MYRRFLNDGDYLSLINDTAFQQLTRGNEKAVIEAEQVAEGTITSYLIENYDIEGAFRVGKVILPYDRKITYPAGVCFTFNNEIYKTIKSINGYKAPSSENYWSEYNSFIDEKMEASIQRYSQMENYHVGDVVVNIDKYYICNVDNGYNFGNVRIPGVEAWKKVEFKEWDSVPYELWKVVRYKEKFYTLISMDNYNYLTNPNESLNWGLIGDYDKTIDTYQLNEHEYVVYNKEVFYPIINPNAECPELENNIYVNDPRDLDLKHYMTQLSLYELYKRVSPNNISTVRINDYNYTIQWLKDAGRLKITLQIPRKRDDKDETIKDWAMATFQDDYNPWENPWFI